MTPKIISKVTPKLFAKKILKFYQEHGRKNLPWQQNPTPYRVWVSEIMLQQTQVKTVIPYYEKFMQSFPSVIELAAADIDQVLQHWQGLGYYSRARNLHKCAQIIISDFSGEFPDNFDHMQSLPGIGRSTAGAILSLAMQKATPILDGNVKRVLARVFLVDGWYGKASVLKQLWVLSEKYTPKQSTAEFNQAMMDLGASLCSRSKPQCDSCILSDVCLACIQEKTQEYPHKKPSKKIPTKETTFLLRLNHKKQIQLLKRPPSGIWGGLWSLPETESEFKSDRVIEKFRHTFTHFHLQITVVSHISESLSEHKIEENSALAWHNINQIKSLALPTPIRKFLFRQFNISESANK